MPRLLDFRNTFAQFVGKFRIFDGGKKSVKIKNFTCPFDERVKYKNSTIVQFYSFDRSWIISSCFFVENIADIKRNILSPSQNINLYHRNCEKIIPVEIEYIIYLIYMISMIDGRPKKNILNNF